MTAARLLLVVATLAFAAMLVWAIGAASLSASFSAIAADPWGFVTLVDLYTGFAMFGLVLAFTEERKLVALAVFAAMLVLGNVITLAWVAWRLPLLWARLARSGP
jgi:hypothetical protein